MIASIGSYSTSTSSDASRAELARLGDDGDDGLADVAHLADRERVVLQVRARHRRDLEERVGQRRDLLAGERPVDARRRLGLRDVDRGDVRVRVRRADEVDEAHAVALDVVDEDALALDEALVLLARDVLALPRLRPGASISVGLGATVVVAAVIRDAALTASKMFQ